MRVIGSLDKQGYTITLENVCPRVCLAPPPLSLSLTLSLEVLGKCCTVNCCHRQFNEEFNLQFLNENYFLYVLNTILFITK